MVTCYSSLVARQDLDSRWNRLGSLVIACFFGKQEPGASQSAYSNNTDQIPVLRFPMIKVGKVGTNEYTIPLGD